MPLKLIDKPLEETGELVAGTFGYSVTKGQNAPVVEAIQGWALFLPKGSPMIHRVKPSDDSKNESVSDVNPQKKEKKSLLLVSHSENAGWVNEKVKRPAEWEMAEVSKRIKYHINCGFCLKKNKATQLT